jgi:cellulose biosynthesis protein BcsQ
MRRVIAVMNAKGGVGKSTVTLMLGEFLAEMGRSVLLIDADPQSSISLMVMTPDRWQASVMAHATISDLLSCRTNRKPSEFDRYIATGVSNIDVQGRLNLLPGSIDLSDIEHYVDRRYGSNILKATTELAAYCRQAFEFTLVDCQPSVTYLTKLWLQLADYHLVPCRCDFPSFNGIEIVDKVIQRMIRAPGFSGKMSRRLGVLLNMKSRRGGGDGTQYENEWEDKIRDVSGGECFEGIIHANRVYAQLNNLFEEDEWDRDAPSNPTTFNAKYPAEQRREVQAVVDEFLAALDKKERRTSRHSVGSRNRRD